MNVIIIKELTFNHIGIQWKFANNALRNKKKKFNLSEHKFLSIIKKNLQFYLSINNYFNPNNLYPKIGGFFIKRRATSLLPFDCSINELALRLKKNPPILYLRAFTIWAFTICFAY